jgi:hypothetical protein
MKSKAKGLVKQMIFGCPYTFPKAPTDKTKEVKHTYYFKFLTKKKKNEN